MQTAAFATKRPKLRVPWRRFWVPFGMLLISVRPGTWRYPIVIPIPLWLAVECLRGIEILATLLPFARRFSRQVNFRSRLSQRLSLGEHFSFVFQPGQVAKVATSSLKAIIRSAPCTLVAVKTGDVTFSVRVV